MNARAGSTAAVEIDGRDDGLAAVGQQRQLVAAAGLLFASPEQQVLAKPDALRQRRERRGRDERGLGLRLLPFLKCGNS